MFSRIINYQYIALFFSNERFRNVFFGVQRYENKGGCKVWSGDVKMIDRGSGVKFSRIAWCKRSFPEKRKF